MYRRLRSKSNIELKELWLISTRVDEDRGIVDVGFRVCGSNVSYLSEVFENATRVRLFQAAGGLMVDSKKK